MTNAAFPTIKDIKNKFAYVRFISRAKARDIPVDISMEYFYELTFSNCAYCGCPPHRKIYAKHKYLHNANGIDRIDNSEGYTKDNCAPCCFACNSAKGVLSVSEFRQWTARFREKEF